MFRRLRRRLRTPFKSRRQESPGPGQDHRTPSDNTAKDNVIESTDQDIYHQIEESQMLPDVICNHPGGVRDHDARPVDSSQPQTPRSRAYLLLHGSIIGTPAPGIVRSINHFYNERSHENVSKTLEGGAICTHSRTCAAGDHRQKSSDDTSLLSRKRNHVHQHDKLTVQLSPPNRIEQFKCEQQLVENKRASLEVPLLPQRNCSKGIMFVEPSLTKVAASKPEEKTTLTCCCTQERNSNKWRIPIVQGKNVRITNFDTYPSNGSVVLASDYVEKTYQNISDYPSSSVTERAASSHSARDKFLLPRQLQNSGYVGINSRAQSRSRYEEFVIANTPLPEMCEMVGTSPENAYAARTSRLTAGTHCGKYEQKTDILSVLAESPAMFTKNISPRVTSGNILWSKCDSAGSLSYSDGPLTCFDGRSSSTCWDSGYSSSSLVTISSTSPEPLDQNYSGHAVNSSDSTTNSIIQNSKNAWRPISTQRQKKLIIAENGTENDAIQTYHRIMKSDNYQREESSEEEPSYSFHIGSGEQQHGKERSQTKLRDVGTREAPRIKSLQRLSRKTTAEFGNLFMAASSSCSVNEPISHQESRKHFCSVAKQLPKQSKFNWGDRIQTVENEKILINANEVTPARSVTKSAFHLPAGRSLYSAPHSLQSLLRLRHLSQTFKTPATKEFNQREVTVSDAALSDGMLCARRPKQSVTGSRYATNKVLADVLWKNYDVRMSIV